MNELNKAIRKLVREVLGMPENSVRPANQNAPASGSKEDQFATVLVTTIDPTGLEEVREEDEANPSTNVKESILAHSRVVASIQFFRGDAITKATRLGFLLKSSGAVSKMQAVGLGLVRVSPVRNLTAVVDTHYEERGQIEVEFYAVLGAIVSTPTYSKFPISVSTPLSTTSSEVTKP